MANVEQELARRLEAGEEVLAATVVRVDGAPPSQPGAKALFGRGRGLAGTLGCSEFDSAVLGDASEVLGSGQPQLRSYRHDLGTIEVFLEPHLAEPRLLVFAGTPIAGHLLEFARKVGFRAVLVEARPERRPPGMEGQVLSSREELEAWLNQHPGPLFAVHTDHDAPDLVDLLDPVMRRQPEFVGLVGSRRHTGHHLELLRRRGMEEARISRIRTPVGLDLGGRGAAEIALSITAGLVAARYGKNGGPLDPG